MACEENFSRRREHFRTSPYARRLADADAASDVMPQLVLPPQYSQRILLASCMMTSSVVSAWINNCPDNCALAFLVLCSSLNYWRHPVYGLRRSFDMLCANGSLAYQLFYTSQFTSERGRAAYWATVAAGGLCYFLGRRFGRTGNFNVSSSLHCCLHLCGNIGNLLLYDSLGPHNLLQLR